MKILIVDDSKAMRSIVRRALRKAGYGDAECEEAENGKLGLDAVGNFSPDLVLCDLEMPGLDGEKLLRMTGTTRAEGRSVPFLVLTISADNLAQGFTGTVFIAYLSSLTNQAYTATQYALFSSFMTLPGKVISGFSGIVVDAETGAPIQGVPVGLYDSDSRVHGLATARATTWTRSTSSGVTSSSEIATTPIELVARM